jgi:hypothetical protein
MKYLLLIHQADVAERSAGDTLGCWSSQQDPS